MIADLKPYPEYKDSGLPWAGSVPGHWELRPAFGAYTPVLERNRGLREKTVLSLSYGRIVVKPADKLHGLVPESFETYQIVNPGDIVLRTTDLQNDHTSLRVGMVHDRGIITSAYLALRTKAGMAPSFGFQFLNVWDRSKAIYGYGSGLRQNLDFSHFKRMPVALPPAEEQAAIVRFLDWANGRLERAIRAKRKIITLLNEQKQAIIHRAVTRGLDPNAPLKPSGIPWLGDIPAHWEVRRMKNIAQLKSGDGITSQEIEETGPYPVFGGNGMRGYTSRYTHDGHYVLIGRQGALCGNINYAQGKFFASEHAVVATLRPGISVQWLGELLRTMNLNQYSQSAAQPGLSVERIKNLAVPFPPESEGELIARDLIGETAPLTAAISCLLRRITLLREYRTRLTSDVVTGKLDVRAAASRLPAAAGSPEPDPSPEEEEFASPDEIMDDEGE
ncbi:MAG: restriction endonuclease subunit S [Candidatus Hydrogenedentes bacterium]|nr:restriction endonuclease subunit S [Candidatus Hydrogenedentota bacterium]